jgi:uncharacterized protein YcaQ
LDLRGVYLMIEMTKEQAKNFLIHHQGLDNYNTYIGKRGVIDFIKKVGCIQYDPLNVIGRNADLVLRSRIKNYCDDMLNELLYKDRVLIDGMDKMMAIYSLDDWPKMKRVREANTKSLIGTMKYRGVLEALDLVEDIRTFVKSNGPTRTHDLSSNSQNEGRWGHKKLSSVALDYMYNSGELGIFGKNNTQKVYEIIEKLLPEKILKEGDGFKSEHEFKKWYLERRIGSVGMLWAKNGGGWLGYFISKKADRVKLLKELVEDGVLKEIKVEGICETFYAKVDDIQGFENIVIENNDMRFLAPLDNLLWDRDMISELFDFEYRWEVYTPKNKRKYGYYVLPVLFGNNLIARFEPEKYDGSGSIKVKNWWWEENTNVTKGLDDIKEKSVREYYKQI